jgi:hypothetical protein
VKYASAFEAAKAGRILDVAKALGLKGRGRRFNCPACGKPDARDVTLGIKGEGFKCFRCEARGSLVDLVILAGKVTAPIEAARWVLGLALDGSQDDPDWRVSGGGGSRGTDAPAPSNRPPAASPENRASNPPARRVAYKKTKPVSEAESEARRAAFVRLAITQILLERKPAAGSLVETWLGARGLSVRAVPDAAARLFFCPVAFYGLAPRDRSQDLSDFIGAACRIGSWNFQGLFAPAMVALIRSPGDARTGLPRGPCGLHVTYLTADGRAKVRGPDGQPSRKMWGRARGGVVLTETARSQGPLFVGEGIETVLSVLQAYRGRDGHAGRGRGLAVLSLNNFQGGLAVDKFGRACWSPVVADPARPAVTFPRAGKVVVLPDNDMSPLAGQDGKGVRTSNGRRPIDQAERCAVSGALAAFNWRRAGAAPVSKMHPSAGRDWNDEILAQSRG